MKFGIFRKAIRPGLDLLANVAVIVASLVCAWALVIDRPQAKTEKQTGPSANDRSKNAAGRPLRAPATPLSVAGAAIHGKTTAPIALIEYADFQCAFCRTFAADVLPQVNSRYIESGKLQYVFRQFPLDSIHGAARPAAIASICAKAQGKFWEMHDRLFKEGVGGDLQVGLRLASAIGLDNSSFSACLQSKSAAAEIDGDVAIAKALGVTGTPTFFLGRVLTDGRINVVEAISGAVPVERLSASIDRLLAPEGDGGGLRP